MDRISNLPDNAFEMILRHLPLHDAVRTSVVSKRWQSRWAVLSKLSLDFVFFHTLYRQLQKTPEIPYPSLVKTVLSKHIGPLHKFVIYIPNLDPPGIGEVDLTIHIALMSGIQELTVTKAADSVPHALPSCLFSCGEQLTKLKLENCVFNAPLEFRGFPSLKALHMNSIICSNLEGLSGFICSCPELRKIKLTDLNKLDEPLCISAPSLEVFSLTGCFRSISFQEAQNLVSLKIVLTEINEESVKTMSCNDFMLHLFSNLGKIKYLELGGHICWVLGADCVSSKLSTELDNLRIIEVASLDLGRKREFHCLLRLIRSSPKLQRLEITVKSMIREPYSDSGDYVDCCFKHLRTVIINKLTGTKSELKMIEILLSHSPLLQFMSIQAESKINEDAKLELSKDLMQFSRTSPTAQILFTYD